MLHSKQKLPLKSTYFSYIYYPASGGWASGVDVMIRLEATQKRSRIGFLAKAGDVSFSERLDWLWPPPKLILNGYR
jgi:hypothetical protein